MESRSNELLDFVREALGRGMARPEVEDALTRAGWSRDMVHGALAGYAEIEFPIPVPKPKPYLSAREAFLYLLLFTTLYIAAFNAGVLAFNCIDQLFPDAATESDHVGYLRDAIRWALSSLIVAFPVFLYLSVFVERGVQQDPVKRRSQVRRCLMYLTVFIAAAVLIGDVITLAYNALGGELTTRFVLKVLTIAALSGTAFGYYLADLKLEDTKPAEQSSRRNRAFAVAAFVIFTGLTAAGLSLIGSPANERARQLDARRVAALEHLSAAANLYYNRRGRLPASIEEMARDGTTVSRGKPPAGPYDYHVTGDKTYEVCATFQRDSAESERDPGNVWSHSPGRQCFKRETTLVQ